MKLCFFPAVFGVADYEEINLQMGAVSQEYKKKEKIQKKSIKYTYTLTNTFVYQISNNWVYFLYF